MQTEENEGNGEAARDPCCRQWEWAMGRGGGGAVPTEADKDASTRRSSWQMSPE